MPSTHSIKQGDTLPILTAILYRDAALTQPVDLTNAAETKIKIKAQGGQELLLNEVAVVVGPATDGKVSYQFKTADWAIIDPGNHNMEFEVTWLNGDIGTYPKDGFATLQVNPDLD